MAGPNDGRRRRRLGRTVLLATLIGISATANLWRIEDESLWCDEQFTLRNAQQPSFAAVIADVVEIEAHPPLYYLLMHYVCSVAEASELTIRLPSVIFSVVGTVFVFLLGELLGGLSLGGVSALFFALMPRQVYFAQEARPYALLTMLIAAGIYLACRVAMDRAEKWHLAVLFPLAFLVVLTHPFGGVFVGFTCLVLLVVWLFERGPMSLYAVGAMLGGAAIGVIIWYPYFRLQVLMCEEAHWISSGTLVSLAISFSRPFTPYTLRAPLPLLATLLTLIAICGAYGYVRRVEGAFSWRLGLTFRRRLTVAMLWTAGPLLALFVGSQFVDCWLPVRNPALLFPATALLLGSLVIVPHRPVVGLVNGFIIAGVLAFGLSQLYTEDQKEQWREAAGLVRALSEPDDRAVISTDGPTTALFGRYYEGTIPITEMPDEVVDPREVSKRMRAGWPTAGGRLWVILSHYGNSPMPAMLRDGWDGMRIELHREFRGVEVLLVSGVPPPAGHGPPQSESES